MAEQLPTATERDDASDPMEAELESFQPTATSPGFAERVGRDLRQPTHRRTLRLWSAAITGLAAAACLAVAFYWWGGRGGGGVPGPGHVADTRPADPVPAVVAPNLPPPSVGAYQRAFSQSPDTLNALLDAHAARVLPPAERSPAVDAFHSSRTRLSTTGDTL